MKQRYLVAVARLCPVHWGCLPGLFILFGVLARPRQAQTSCALANGDYFENFVGSSTWANGFAGRMGAARCGVVPTTVAIGTSAPNAANLALTPGYYFKATRSACGPASVSARVARRPAPAFRPSGCT